MLCLLYSDFGNLNTFIFYKFEFKLNSAYFLVTGYDFSDITVARLQERKIDT